MPACNLQLGACATRTHGQKRVSNRVGSPCSARKQVLRVICAISAAARARGVEKRGPRSEVCHASEWLCLELLSIILGQVEERFTSLLVAVLMRRRDSTTSVPRVYTKGGEIPESASISDATTQMDHNAVVLFTIDRLARSPRTTVRTRGTELAPDRWFIK